MNQKIIALLIGLMLTAATWTGYGQTRPRPASNPITTLRTFYLNYMHAAAQSTNASVARRKYLEEEFCTDKLLNKLENMRRDLLNADPFLNSQDFDSSSIKTLDIKKEPQLPNAYMVSYTDLASHRKLIIYLTLIKQGPAFRIDSFWYPKNPEATYDAKTRSAIKVIRDFYTGYILMSSSPNGQNRLAALKSLRFSKNFVSKTQKNSQIGGLDPFLKSNNVNNASIPSIAIVPDPKNSQLYSVSFLDKNKKKVSVHVAVVMENNQVKIDNIY